jgi:hypothetical protein
MEYITEPLRFYWSVVPPAIQFVKSQYIFVYVVHG